MTTMVVAYTSFWLGHVTRPISLRTSDRKRRDRPHQPVTLPSVRPLNESSLDSAIAFVATSPASRLNPLLARRDPRPTPRTGRTGGNRTPNPRFWRPVSSSWRSPVGASRRLRSAGSLKLPPLRSRFVARSASVALARPACPSSLPTPNWQDRRESNPQPPVLETGALPIELLSSIHRGASPLGLPYTVALCPVCLRQNRQYFENSRRSLVFFLFFVVL